MIASVPINTPLSWPTREHWLLALLEGETLGEILSTVRGDWGRRTPGYLSQLKMAKRLKEKHGDYAPSQGTISNIENDTKSILDLHAKVRLDFLRLYPLTEKQIVELDERFNLELPDVRNSTNPNVINLAGVRLVTLRIVGHSGAGEPLTVLESTLKGYRAESCVAVLTSGPVLACERVRDEYKAAASLIFSSEKKPEPGKVVLYRFKETDDYLICIYRETPETFPAISYDGTRAMTLAHDDPRLEFCGTQFSGTIDERFTSDRRSN